MLRKVMADQASEAAGGEGAAMAKGRGSSFFTVPRLFVGFTAKCLSDCDSSRSPTSPLDLKAFSNLGSSLLKSPRSPRSWDCKRVGLSLVDSLAEDAKNCSDSCRDVVLFGSQMRLSNPQQSLKSYSSLPKDCGQSLRKPFHLHGAGCADTAACCRELGKTRSCPSPAMEAGGLSLPCTRFYGDRKSGPEAIRSDALQSNFDHSFDADKFAGSLPLSIGGARRYIGSLSASEIEQSEDYTCIISHGPNPKTTHIFGDCILEPHTIKEAKEEAESYWIVKPPVDPPTLASEDFLSFCFSCRKKLEGNDIYIYRGEKAFCSGSCRDQEILIEEEGEKNTMDSPGSTCSSFHDDIFMAGMAVAT